MIALLCAVPLLAQAQTPVPPVPQAHSDNWCADAVDFAMGAAQNRELGYTLEIVAGSIQRTPGYFQRMFESLSVADMQQLTETVYEHQWSRFQAAQGISESCIVQ